MSVCVSVCVWWLRDDFKWFLINSEHLGVSLYCISNEVFVFSCTQVKNMIRAAKTFAVNHRCSVSSAVSELLLLQWDGPNVVLQILFFFLKDYTSCSKINAAAISAHILILTFVFGAFLWGERVQFLWGITLHSQQGNWIAVLHNEGNEETTCSRCRRAQLFVCKANFCALQLICTN